MSLQAGGRGGAVALVLGLVSLAIGCASDPAAAPESAPAAQAEATPPAAAAVAPAVLESDRLFGLALDRWIERTGRLQQISQRIRVAAHDQCESQQSAVFGAAVLDLSALPEVLEGVGQARFGAERGLFVTAVFPGMAAARAGIEPGDQIVKLAGLRVGTLRELGVGIGSKGGDFDFGVRRDGRTQTISVAPDRGCGSPAELVLSETINAYARKDRLVFTTGLMREVRDESSLALVVGHEIAHQVLDYKRTGVDTYSVRRESRADYLGIYLAATAGFALEGGPDLYLTLNRDLNRLAKRNVSHPTGPERTLAFRKTMEEITERRRAGLPLSPGQ